MPQIQLPIFPEGVTHINNELAFCKRDGRVVYFNGAMPIFTHAENDIATYRMITSQFAVTGIAKQVEIAKAFGVPARTVKRYVKLYREHGPSGFYAPKRRRGPSVLVPEMLEEIQGMLDDGHEVSVIAKELGPHAGTLHKAIKDGRLHQAEKKTLS